MESLRQFIEVVNPDSVRSFADLPVKGVACHPDQVTGPGFLFVCMDEFLEYNRWQTWRSHLEVLPGLQLAALVTPQAVDGLAVPQLITPEPRKALGRAARLLAGSPDEAMRVLGVTGTNGKTTTTRLLAHLLTRLGQPCGSIGTLGTALDGRFDEPGTYTTPLAPQLHATLRRMRDAGARAVAMEVSSHALALDRVEGLAFSGAILTNVERDHLDFHGTEEAYAAAKRRLFETVRADGWCVLNRASPHCDAFAESCSGNVVTYGTGAGADVVLEDLELRPDRTEFRVAAGGRQAVFTTRLAGSFQAENTLAAIALVQALGWPLEAIARALADFPPVCGRMEQIPMPNGGTAIVDYAHNPDGLRHLLSACRPFCRGRLHVVFGCGGDRDKGKRPLMGRIAQDLADVCWVTSDNPRTEDPEGIIDDILRGMNPGKTTLHRIPDRAAAIREAYHSTAPEDVLVVAGKGHEDYQIIGFEKHYFSDQAVLRSNPGRRL